MNLDDLDVAPEAEDDPIGDRLGQLLAALLDSAALDSIPPPQPVIDGLLYAGSLAWLHGKPGNGKSFVALDWAGCVAAGLPWQDRVVTPGDVLYIAAEGTSGLRQRVRAWEAYTGQVWEAMALPVAAQVLSPVDGAALAALAAKLRPLLVVIDTQARVTTGYDENSARDMGQYVAAADRIRSASGACVLTVHHEARNGDNMRGSTALEGAAATVMRASKDGSLITVSTVKQKDAPAADEIRLRLVPRLESAVLVSNDLIRNTGEVTDSEDKVMATLLECFVGISASPKQIIEISKLPQSTAYRALSLLVSRGRVVKGGTKQRPLYELSASELPTLLTASNPTASQTSHSNPPFRGLEGLEVVSSGDTTHPECEAP